MKSNIGMTKTFQHFSYEEVFVINIIFDLSGKKSWNVCLFLYLF